MYLHVCHPVHVLHSLHLYHMHVFGLMYPHAAGVPLFGYMLHVTIHLHPYMSVCLRLRATVCLLIFIRVLHFSQRRNNSVNAMYSSAGAHEQRHAYFPAGIASWVAGNNNYGASGYRDSARNGTHFLRQFLSSDRASYR